MGIQKASPLHAPTMPGEQMTIEHGKPINWDQVPVVVLMNLTKQTLK